MIIRDTPDDLDKFYAADNDVAFKLHQKGFPPKYIDNDVVYFLKTNKLLKLLKKMGIEVNIQK